MSATEEAKHLASKNFGHKAITFKLHLEKSVEGYAANLNCEPVSKLQTTGP
jgi:hypothetical protein